jgi:hypothetical protein
LADGLLDHLLHAGLLGHVDLDGRYLASESTNVVGGLLDRRGIDIGTGNICPSFGDGFGKALPKPASRTGDQHHFS